MPNPNDADLVRIYTREAGGTIAATTPHVSTGGHSFEVVVEAEAGSVIGGSLQPYTISLVAFDLTAGANPGAPFSTSTAGQHFDNVSGNISVWPSYEERFTITLTAAQATAVANHVLQYTAALVSGGTNPVTSFAQSPLFILL